MRCEVCDQDSTITVTKQVDGQWRKVGYCEEHNPSFLNNGRGHALSVPASWPTEGVAQEVWVKQSQIDHRETIAGEDPLSRGIRLKLEPWMAGEKIRLSVPDEKTGEQRPYLLLTIGVEDKSTTNDA